MMFRSLLHIAACIFCGSIFSFPVGLQANGTENQAYFTSDPALSPDGHKIVFAYEDDLWTVSSEGGMAQRITGMAGRESNPHYSPDGQWIAFTGRQDGNANVYLIPVAGGEIKQLTFHDGTSAVESWSWDSKYIYFSSDAYNMLTSYKIAASGGTPVRLFPNYFNWPHSLIENPKTGEYYFTDSWESSRFASRKRYKGSFNPDIKSWNPTTHEFKVHTSWIGKDMWPTIDSLGNIYYVSDEANNEYNLYVLKDDKPVKLTLFSTSIKQPQVDAAGDKIVFEKDYQIYIYGVSSSKTNQVDIRINGNITLGLPEEFNVRSSVTAFDLSADEKKIAFVSRGTLFVCDAEGKFIKEIKTAGPGRVIEVKWMADNATLVYTKTVHGWANLFKIAANGQGEEITLTQDTMTDRMLVLDKKRSFGVYLSGKDALRAVNMESGKTELLTKDEFWAIENASPAISPDGHYVAYAAKRNFEDDIFLYHFDDKKVVNLTQTGVSETEPSWSPDGKYIYFTTDRENPAYPYGFESAKIYRIALDNYEKDFKENHFDRLFSNDFKEDTSINTPYPINMDNISERWEQITTSGGNHSLSFIPLKKDETVAYFYSSSEDEGLKGIMRWSRKPFETAVTKKVDGSVAETVSWVEGKHKTMVLAGTEIYLLEGDGLKLKKIDLDYQFTRNLKNEFQEMFEETWTALDENYYDPKFHGADWDKLHAVYAACLQHVRNRADLRILLNDMLGELNSSHQGFYSAGPEESGHYRTQTLATGIIFDENHHYLVAGIVHGSPIDKKEVGVEAGDELISVNGVAVDQGINRDYYFESPVMPDGIDLTFKRKTRLFQTRIHPETSAALKAQLYDEWVAANRKRVDEKSGKRIAYIQMKDMTQASLDKFRVDIASRFYNHDALILDIRYNTGGNVHDKVLDILSRKPYLQWKYRDGKITAQPNFFPAGKTIVLLVNEQTLSDGEMTAAGFQALALGKIIGTETYRWIIFTSAKSMVDGSICRLPSWGCYKMNGDDIERVGVTPDISVANTLKDRTEGNDPQLEKAIEVIMQFLK